MTDDLRHVLIRGRTLNFAQELGAAIATEIIYRDVTFTTRTRDGETSQVTRPGIALLGDSTPGSANNLEPFVRHIGKIVATIQRLPEFVFTPVNAHRDPMVELWTVECVPFTEWFRLVIKTDEQILREAGMR